MKGSSIIKSIFKFIFIFILAISIIGVVIVSAIMIAVSKNFPDIDQIKLQSMLQETSYIYDDAGNISEKVQSGIDRTIVPIEQIPTDLQKAFIAIEDERFYEHGGVDFKRLIGALVHDIKVGSFEQGGSTINMQLSKNLLTSTEKSALRKVTDIVYAIKLDQKLDKSDIMYAYLNTVFLGSNVNGVQAAARAYFNKDVGDLSLMECAIIAGITQYPTKYIPYTLSEITPQDDISSLQIKLYPPSDGNVVPTEVQKKVYDALKNAGKIDYYEDMMLKNGSLVVTKATLNPKSVERGKVVLSKMRELGIINEEKYQGALNENVIINFPQRNNRDISTYFNDRVKKEAVKILVEQGNTEEQANNLLKFGGLKIYSTLNTKIQQILEREFANKANFPNSYFDQNGVIQPQAAMVIIDQHTGDVKAYIGGRGQYGSLIFDRADNPRQPGSAIKPLAVYLLALKDGMTPNTMINDKPREDSTSSTGFWPKNIHGVYYGNRTMKFLLAVSSNVAAVKTLETLAPTKIAAANRSLDYLTQMGFKHLVRSSENPAVNDENLSLALGGLTKGVTTLEMTSAYAGIANLGKQNSPVFITKILDSTDKVIYESKPKVFEMISENKASQMVDMLVGVVKSGSAISAKLSNMPSAGKTGTTTDVKDVYFAGFTPYYTGSIWIGSDTPRELSYTSEIPTKLWAKVMNKIDSELSLEPKGFNKSDKPYDPSEEEIDSLDGDTEQTNAVEPTENQQLDGIIFEENQGQQNQDIQTNTVEPNQGQQAPSTNSEQQSNNDNNNTQNAGSKPKQPSQPQQPVQPQPPTDPTPERPQPPAHEDTGQQSAPPVSYENSQPAQDNGGSNDDSPIF